MKNIPAHTPQRGYIALASALIIAAILTAFVFTSSARVFLSRSAEMNHENMLLGQTLARSCAFVALSAFRNEPTFSPRNELVTVSPNETCRIDSMVATPESVEVITSATVYQSYVAYDLVARIPSSQAPFSSITWKEITSIPP